MDWGAWSKACGGGHGLDTRQLSGELSTLVSDREPAHPWMC